jgi:DNA invertase Pin-like site-specific DNA recombinase
LTDVNKIRHHCKCQRRFAPTVIHIVGTVHSHRRNTQLVLALEEFRSLGIDFISHQEALDTLTPMGRAMFTIIAAMAELERSVICERVMAGLQSARQHGTKSGKPIGRPRAVFRRDKIEEMRGQGLGWRRIGRELGVSATTIRRAYRTPASQ